MSTRWIHELAIPGRADMSSVYASYFLTAIFVLALAALRFNDSLLLSLAAGLSAGLQLPLLLGVVISKTRAALPPPTGIFGVPNPTTLADISWTRALAGFAVTGMIIVALLL